MGTGKIDFTGSKGYFYKYGEFTGIKKKVEGEIAGPAGVQHTPFKIDKTGEVINVANKHIIVTSMHLMILTIKTSKLVKIILKNVV